MALPAVLLIGSLALAPEPPPVPRTWAVDAGTTGVLVEDHRAPLVAIRVEFPAGTWSPWTRSHHAEEAFTFQDGDPERALKRRADALGIDLRLSMGERAATLSTTCLARDLDGVVGLIRDVLANSRYDEHDLKRSSRERALRWKSTETDVGFRLGQEAARTLYADPADPRRRAWEKPEALETRSSRLAPARDLLIRLPGRTVGFAGDLTPDEARRWAAGLLPDAAATAPQDLPFRLGPLTPPASRESSRAVPMRKLTQVYFSYLRDSLPWSDPSRPAFVVANHVLGGHFFSRLYVALRHEGGETYGASTRETGDVVPESYAATTFTRAENAPRTEEKLRATLMTFHEKGITEEERRDAVGALQGERAFARQAPGQILARFLLERRLGLPPGTLDAIPVRAAALSLDEVNAFIRAFYAPEGFVMRTAVPAK